MFNFSFDKRTIYIILAVLVGMTVLQYMSNATALLMLVLSIPGVLIAITFHEFAHGLAANILGDDTAKRQGRLNLNPLSHIDPIGIVLLLLAGFGWGKPVSVNPRNYTKKLSLEQCEAIVSIAGPLMNMILAFIVAIIYYVVIKFAPQFAVSEIGSMVTLAIAATVSINVGLGIFNLIPLPPLDGSKVLMLFLPYKAKQWFRNNSQIFYIIFVILFVTGFAGVLITPAIDVVMGGISTLAALIVGV